MIKFAVITKIPTDPDRMWENLAMPLGAMLADARYPERTTELPPSYALSLRTKVFELGEILVIQGDREPGGHERKPSKWGVEYETFSDIDQAVERSREVSP